MSSATEPTLGQSKSNASVAVAATKLFTVYRKLHGLLPSVAWEEIEGDNCQAYFARICVFLCKNPIPVGGAFDDNLEPTTTKNNRALTYGTLELYIGQHFKLIRNQYPQHEDWKNLSVDEFPQWYSKMKVLYKKDAQRFQMNNEEDVVFGLDDIQPLYKDNGVPIASANNIRDFVSYIDLRKILLNTVVSGKKSSMMHRCIICLTSECAARGGEVRFQNFNDWMYHPSLEITDIGWSEMKTINTYAMPMVSDKVSWLFDFYHYFGSYFCVENGLYRSEEDVKKGRMNMVFPSLMNVHEKSTTRQLTTILQSNLPSTCPQKIRKSYTARSLRKGTITELTTDGRMTSFDVCARSGHSTGTSLDYYIDKNNVSYSVRAAKARAGYKNLNAPSKVPNIDSLGSELQCQLRNLMEKLFIVSVPAFKEDGKLHSILRICLASVIMHHPQVTEDCGPTNLLSAMLTKAAREVKLYDPRFPNYSPELLLTEWSTIIKVDYERRSVEFPEADNECIASVAATVNHTLKMVSSISSSIKQLELESKKQVGTIATQEATILSLKEDLKKANGKIAALRTVLETPPRHIPAPTTASKRGSGSIALEEQQLATIEEGSPLKKRSIYDAFDSKQRHSEVPDPGEKGAELKDLLMKLRDGSVINEDIISKTCIPKGLCKEIWLLQHCLDLCQVVSTKEERKILARRESDAIEVQQTAQAIQNKCMEKMCVLEGLDPELERKNKCSRKVGTYLGLGNRIHRHRVKLIERRGLIPGKKKGECKPLEQPLVPLGEVDDATRKGTPPGHRSMVSYFGKRKDS